MVIQIYSAQVTSATDALLPGLHGAAEWMLWLQSQDLPHFEEQDIAILMRAFEPLRGIVWSVSSGGSRTQRIRDHLRALGRYPSLKKNLVSQTTIQDLPHENKLYSDVAWLSPDSSGDLADLFNENRAGCDNTVAFIPSDEKVAQKWSKVVAGLSWLRLCEEWVATSPQPPLDAHSVVLSYIRLTINLQGAAGLVSTDYDAKNRLVFWGSRSLLEGVAARLAVEFDEWEAAAFTLWFGRGPYLVASP